MTSVMTYAPPTAGTGLVAHELLPAYSSEQRTVRAAHHLYESLIQLWSPGVIEAAHDLGVFTALADGPATARGLAAALGTDTHATRVLLEALVVFRVLEHGDDTGAGREYRLSEEMRDCLLPGLTYSLCGKIAYDRQLAWDAWRHLADRVRTGSRDSDGRPAGNQISAEEYESLVGGINFWAPPIVDTLVRALETLGWSAEQARFSLDVGCGAGLYSQLLLQHFPRLEATGFDVPEIIPLARRQAARLGVADRFAGVECDFTNADWGTGFDLIMFANIFHLQTREAAQDLLLRASKAISDDGLIAIADQMVDDRVDSPQGRFAKLFAVSMLATGGGDAYEVDDYEEWLRASGLETVALLDAPMHRILIARRIGA